jgi:branched-subunit amino acid permease
VVSIVVLFSVVDIFKYFLGDGFSSQVDTYIPFSEQYLGWVLPGLIAFVSANLLQKKNA